MNRPEIYREDIMRIVNIVYASSPNSQSEGIEHSFALVEELRSANIRNKVCMYMGECEQS